MSCVAKAGGWQAGTGFAMRGGWVARRSGEADGEERQKPYDRFLTLIQEVRYARRIYWKIAGRWTHLHFKSKEIIDRLKIDGVRVVERVSDYLESFDKLTINSNNQRNDAI